MAIAPTDILFKYSVKTGAAGNSVVGTPAGSLGKYISQTAVPNTGSNVIFDDISGDENAASTADYRCIFVHNAHGTLALQNPVVYFTETAGGANIAIAVDAIASSILTSSSAQAAEIANELTPPTGIGAGFVTTPITKATGLSLGSSLAAGWVKAIWIRRTAANSIALNADGFVLNVAGDTAA